MPGLVLLTAEREQYLDLLLGRQARVGGAGHQRGRFGFRGLVPANGCEVALRLTKARLQGNGAFEGGFGFWDFAQRRQGQSQVFPGLGPVGFRCNRLAETGGCLTLTLCAAQGETQAVQRAGKAGFQGQGVLVAGDGRISLSSQTAGVAERVMREEVARVLRREVVQQGDRLPELATGEQQFAKQARGIEMRGFLLQHLPV